MISKVPHLTVLDIHPRFSHVRLGSAIARLVVVGDDLGDGADVRPTIFFVFIGGVLRGVPRKHLARCKLVQSKSAVPCQSSRFTSTRLYICSKMAE